MCPIRLARIDAFLQTRYIDTGKLPHAHLVVAHGGQVVHRSLLGQATLATAETPAARLRQFNAGEGPYGQWNQQLESRILRNL